MQSSNFSKISLGFSNSLIQVFIPIYNHGRLTTGSWLVLFYLFIYLLLLTFSIKIFDYYALVYKPSERILYKQDINYKTLVLRLFSSLNLYIFSRV